MAHNVLEAHEETIPPLHLTAPSVLEPLRNGPASIDHPVAMDPNEDMEEDIEYYYDSHPTEEDLMGQSEPQSRVLYYILQVLKWLYRNEGWFIAADLNIYQTRNKKEYPAAPDIAVFKGVILTESDYIQSWALPQSHRPAPQVVFEFASGSTWRKDVYEKPKIYADMGIPEYYFFDPRPTKRRSPTRLRGWRTVNGIALPMAADERGWLWSDELNSWLAAEGENLRLFNADGVMRLTGEEAERAAKEQERAAKEQERAAKEQERAVREREQAARERAWAKLRELGVDPESLQ